MLDDIYLDYFAAYQARFKNDAPIIKTNTEGNLRGMLDEELYKRWTDSNGQTDCIHHQRNGVTLFKLSAVVSKPSKEKRFEITDWDAYEDWCMNGGKEVLQQALYYAVRCSNAPIDKGFAEWYFTETGELPEGCEIVTHEIPGGKWLGTRLSGCKPEVVFPALGMAHEPFQLPEGGE